jgi:hypothetical protein
MRYLMACVSIIMVLLGGCEELPPAIDFTDTGRSHDSSYIISSVPVPQHKAVLIEDITGVRCNNCPSAAKKAYDIMTKRTEDSVVILALYTESLGTLTAPWPGFPVLTSNSATQITSSLGLDQGLPTGYIDRHVFPPKDIRYNAYTVWENLVNQRLQLKTPVNIDIQHAVSARKIIARVRLQYTQSVSGIHKVSLFLVESGIVSKQTTQSGADDQYVHNHVLRYTFGSDLGRVLTESLVPGRTFIREFEYEVPAEFNMVNCHLICMVADHVTEDVVNVRQVKLQ